MISPRLARLALVCLAFFLIASGLASAQQPFQPNWRMYFKTTDTNGMNSNGDMTVAVYSGYKDGYGVDGTASDSQDGVVSLSQASVRAIAGAANGRALIKDIKSPRSPMDSQYDAYGHRKVWFLRVAGLGSASSLDTVLTMGHVSISAGLPPLTLPYLDNGVLRNVPVKYYLKMVDNRGVAGAPENGTLWEVPMPATFEAVPPTTWKSVSFFSLTLPTFNTSTPISEQALLNEGYKLEFYQELVTPEPSSIMALACGVMGLGGMFLRRRR